MGVGSGGWHVCRIKRGVVCSCGEVKGVGVGDVEVWRRDLFTSRGPFSARLRMLTRLSLAPFFSFFASHLNCFLSGSNISLMIVCALTLCCKLSNGYKLHSLMPQHHPNSLTTIPSYPHPSNFTIQTPKTQSYGICMYARSSTEINSPRRSLTPL